MSFDGELAIVVTDTDAFANVYKLSDGTLYKRLTFNEEEGGENFLFRGCAFSYSRRYLFTVTWSPGKKSYVTKWNS